jgi:hypothetical protein
MPPSLQNPCVFRAVSKGKTGRRAKEVGLHKETEYYRGVLNYGYAKGQGVRVCKRDVCVHKGHVVFVRRTECVCKGRVVSVKEVLCVSA